jgi:Fe2+ transport system protein FeoA
MSESENRVRVVAINSREDLLQILREIGEAAGFDIVTAKPGELGDDPIEIQEFLRRHNARVVVYEVVPPYRDSWDLLRRLRQAEMVSGSWRQYVITSPSKAELEREVGPTRAIEVKSGEVDRQALTEAIRRGVLV